MAVSVLLIDDHPVVRQGVKQIIRDQLPHVAVDEAGGAREALERLHRRKWSLIMLDLSLPEKTGLEFLGQLRQMFPETPVLVLSIYPEDEYAARVLRAGAAGYLNKSCARDELVFALERVLGGQKFISRAAADNMALRSIAPSRHESLSNREYEVMRAISAGKKLTEIARELSLSVKTVSTYKRRVLTKMNLASNADLTRYAIDHRLL